MHLLFPYKAKETFGQPNRIHTAAHEMLLLIKLTIQYNKNYCLCYGTLINLR